MKLPFTLEVSNLNWSAPVQATDTPVQITLFPGGINLQLRYLVYVPSEPPSCICLSAGPGIPLPDVPVLQFNLPPMTHFELFAPDVVYPATAQVHGIEGWAG